MHFHIDAVMLLIRKCPCVKRCAAVLGLVHDGLRNVDRLHIPERSPDNKRVLIVHVLMV